MYDYQTAHLKWHRMELRLWLPSWQGLDWGTDIKCHEFEGLMGSLQTPY